MNSLSKWEQWTSPQVVLAILGYISLAVGAWLSFDGRIAANEKDIAANAHWIAETRGDLRRMDDKLDRLIERKPS
jgi:hypothetical protein